MSIFAEIFVFISLNACSNKFEQPSLLCKCWILIASSVAFQILFFQQFSCAIFQGFHHDPIFLACLWQLHSVCIYRNNHNIFYKLQDSIIFQWNTTHYCVYIKCYNGIRKKKVDHSYYQDIIIFQQRDNKTQRPFYESPKRLSGYSCYLMLLLLSVMLLFAIFHQKIIANLREKLSDSTTTTFNDTKCDMRICTRRYQF